jgi:lysine 6-dehydrogenase
VDAIGARGGRPWRARAEMVDRWSDGFTAMARTTGFTASVVARLIARGEIRGRGLQRPEAVVAGAIVDRLLEALAVHGLRITFEDGPGAAGERSASSTTPGFRS